MKRMMLVLLVLLASISIRPAPARAEISASVNFDWTIGAPCADAINANPLLWAGQDGDTEIRDTNYAGGGAPECYFYPSTAMLIQPTGDEKFTGIGFFYNGSFSLRLIDVETLTVVYDGYLSGAGYFMFSDASFDEISLMALRPSQENYIDNLQLGPNLPGCDQMYPNLSSALVTNHMPGFWQAGGSEAVKTSAGVLDLLHDVDGNGQDEYVVITKATVAGERWGGLFIGACQPVYVPLANVTLLRPMEW